MITRSRKRMKRASLWLDKMPAEICEKIASLVRDGKYTDEALHLARTSDVQRRAVVASVPSSATFELSNVDLNDEWADMLDDHVREVIVHEDPDDPNQRKRKHSAMLRLLQAPAVTRTEIPGINAFVIALRQAKSLTSLMVHVRRSSHRSLLCTLKQKGQSLCKLELLCHECSRFVHDSRCLAKLFKKGGWGKLANLCPSVKEVSIDCGKLPPSTISTVVNGLPQLTAARVSSSGICNVSLSERDILALRRLDSVDLQNISGGIREVVRVGTSVIRVALVEAVTSNVVRELVQCTRVRSFAARMGVEEMKTLTDIVRHLPSLTELRVLLGCRTTFNEIQSAASQAVKILRVPKHPLEVVSLGAQVAAADWHSPTEQMDRLSVAVAGDGGKATFSESDRFLLCTIELEGV